MFKLNKDFGIGAGVGAGIAALALNTPKIIRVTKEKVMAAKENRANKRRDKDEERKNSKK